LSALWPFIASALKRKGFFPKEDSSQGGNKEDKE
jgi:hypothetical protein